MTRQRLWQLARRAEGRCIGCGEPSPTGHQHCVGCRAKRDLRRSERRRELRALTGPRLGPRRRYPERVIHRPHQCGDCKQIGHNRRTCPGMRAA